MTMQLQDRLELFAANTQKVKASFPWKEPLIKRLAALLYAAESKAIDCESIKESYDLVKQNTGLFSIFRGNSALSIATLLSLSEDKAARLSQTLTVYDMMKDAQFSASDYLAVSAYQIAAHAQPNDYFRTVERAKAFYDGMKKDHLFLTGQDDYIFAAMLGLTDMEVSVGVARIEQLFVALKTEFWTKSGVQALAQVLVLGGKESSDRVLALRNAFLNQAIRLDKEYTISSLGVLSLLPAEINTIVGDVNDAYNFLRGQKGFGKWTISKQELLLIAAALVAFENMDTDKSGIMTTTIATSITNIIISQQIALTMVAASSASAAAASAGS